MSGSIPRLKIDKRNLNAVNPYRAQNHCLSKHTEKVAKCPQHVILHCIKKCNVAPNLVKAELPLILV